ncbi:adenosine deaminase [Jannaschia formosa]|uniref:adenosine deaminase n=1 Tax=Jannaschia formosa TaxID=2259592 RepID=UPI001FD87257|nr:adenosine deaminase [Jannaschia formosa]
MTDLPRIELHLHIEGAAPPAFIRGLAAEKDVTLRGVFDETGAYAFRDFGHFLQVYEAATEVLKTPDDYRRLTRAVLEQSAEHGVVYTEMFLSPDFCGGRDVPAWRDYLAAIREGAAEVPEVEMRGVVTCIRHFGPDKARETATCAAETAGEFVTGFGMGGNEAIGTQGDFAWAFDCAREAGLGLTTHAGEFGGPESVRQALELGVSRIGHGVRCIEDDTLVDRLAEDGIVLEVCPGSNVALGLYPRFDRHPIERLRERGVKVTVSTDDPPFFHTDMTREYEALNRAFGWDEAIFSDIYRTAAEAAFCDAATRKRLLDRLAP